MYFYAWDVLKRTPNEYFEKKNCVNKKRKAKEQNNV